MDRCSICNFDKNGTVGCLCDIGFNKPEWVAIPRRIFNKLVQGIPLNIEDRKELKNLK
jgi:hypothetical protein